MLTTGHWEKQTTGMLSSLWQVGRCYTSAARHISLFDSRFQLEGEVLMRKQSGKISIYRSGRRRFSPLALLGIMMPAILVMIAGISFATPKIFSSYAADGEHQPQQ